MELRQLRYFVSLAEELHFGRAAEREHIAQSAMSQHLRRLEGELHTRLIERTTHCVELTAAGTVLVAEARQILAHIERATVAAQDAAKPAPALRVGVVDAAYDSLPEILRHVRTQHPDVEIDEVEAGVPEQCRMLAAGHLDVGLGSAALAPPEIAAALFRLDPLGVLLREDHRLAGMVGVPVAHLATEPLLFADDRRAPEFNNLVRELCHSGGFLPIAYRGTVESLRATADLVLQGRCVACAPASCRSAGSGLVWRPLIRPGSLYPWSLLWRAGDRPNRVSIVIAAARRVAQELSWLEPLKPAVE